MDGVYGFAELKHKKQSQFIDIRETDFSAQQQFITRKHIIWLGNGIILSSFDQSYKQWDTKKLNSLNYYKKKSDDTEMHFGFKIESPL